MADETNANGTKQWMRYCRIYVSKDGSNEQFLDLSSFSVNFKISQQIIGKPSTAVVIVTNLSKSTADKINVEYNQVQSDKGLRLVIDAGYENNHAIVFDGDLWFKTTGRTSETDNYIKLIAARGDRAYQYAFCNRTLAKGAGQKQIFEALAEDMKRYGISEAEVPKYLLEGNLPRGKVLYGQTHRRMDEFCRTNNLNWGFGDNAIVTMMYQPVKYTDQEVVILNVKTGLIGRPQLTQTGVECRCLLNPRIGLNTIFQIDNASLQRGDLDTSYQRDFGNELILSDYATAPDGLYKVFSCEIVADTRGQNWYCDLKATALNGGQVFSTTPQNSI